MKKINCHESSYTSTTLICETIKEELLWEEPALFQNVWALMCIK